MPGTNARAIEKARTLPADAVILDLEDSIAPEAKADAREGVRAAIKAGGFGSREVAVRINGLDTEHWLADIDMIHDARPDVILVPKVAQPVTLENLADRLMDLGTDHKIKVWAMIETPVAILNVREIAAVARDRETRLSCLVIGTNDLAKEMRARIVPGRAPVVPLLVQAIVAARAHGLDILDGPFNDLGNAEGFARGMRAGARPRLRRQDADSSEPDRALQRDLHAERGRDRAGARDHRGVRSAGEPRQGRHRARRPHGRAAARRHRAAHGGDRRRGCGARGLDHVASAIAPFCLRSSPRKRGPRG